ncbi:MAG: arylsulfatase A [Candidatus Pelagisphaera sp.]|jgi:arylsulfatase A
MRLTTLLLLLLAFATSAFSANERPNIILFLADDLGWTGLSSFGSDFYETPNLDRLASKGVKFTNAYAACTVCSPTRASIMTGMYPARLRLTDFIAGQNRPFAKTTIPDWTKGLDKNYTTIAEALKGGGYRTIHVGKWHLDFPNQPNQGATAHGFDVSHDKPKGTRGYFIKDKTVQDLGLKTNYTTDYLTDKAIEEIDRSKENPFFLYFAYNVPHTPIQGRDDLVAYFEKKVDPNATHNNPTYAAMVKSLDLSIGRVLDHLDANGLSENTLIVFTSDNGGLTQRNGKHDEFTENLPLRRGKGSAYEGGVRVPAIAYWPGITQPGTVSKTPVITTDYYPTFLAAAGVKGVQSHNAAIDGKNLIPIFKNSARSIDRNLFWHFPHYHAGGDGPYSSIRSGDWRLVEFHEDGKLELYRIGNDLGESSNLAANHPEKRAQLQAELHKWRRSLSAQMPTPNPNHDPAKASEVAKSRN